MGKSEGLEKRPVFQFILESEYRTTHRCLTPTRTGTRDIGSIRFPSDGYEE